MARIYKPATFQPTVRPDWGGVLTYLSQEEKSAILEAIIKYPSVNCTSKFWLETIKPDLDFQYETFENACKRKSQAIRERWGKISITSQHMNKTSTTSVEDMNKISITSVIDGKEKDKDKREDERKKKKIDLFTKFNAGYQNWVFSTEILPLAKKYWRKETIREIEINFSCQEYATETSIGELLERYPGDKSPKFVKPTIEEIKEYVSEQGLVVSPEAFYDFYESKGWKVGKDSMKDWKSAIRGWNRREKEKPQKNRNYSFFTGEGSFLKDDPLENWDK